MSTQRRTPGIYASPTPKDADGNRLCRNCRGPMPPDKRRHNCSAKCTQEWMRKTSPQIMRQAVFERDKGICSKCGVNTVAERRVSTLYIHIARGTGHLWQADHIIPVIEGGGECGLENLQTLCIPCHKKETAALRKRLAEKRKAEKSLPLLPACVVSVEVPR